MKKILFVFIVFAIASYGGINLNARAVTLTPAEIAAFERQIETMRATALTLSSAAAAAPVSQNITVSVMMTLSPQEIAQINVALDSLKAVLITIQTQLATNPQLAEQNLPVVITSLKSISTTLAEITGTLRTAHGSAIASAPAAVSVPAPAPAQTGSKPVARATPSTNQAANQPQAGEAPTFSDVAPVAQVASTWSWKNLNWQLTFVLFLVVLAVGLWLFWPEEKGSAKGKGTQKSPAPLPSVLVSTAREPRPTVVVTTPAKQNAVPQTPLSAAISVSAQNPSLPPQSQQQQRKPA